MPKNAMYRMHTEPSSGLVVAGSKRGEPCTIQADHQARKTGMSYRQILCMVHGAWCMAHGAWRAGKREMRKGTSRNPEEDPMTHGSLTGK
jgi:hypothetical protein